MRKRTIVAALGCMIIGSTILSACSAPISASTFPEVIQVQTVPAQENKISLTSRETVEVVPDMAEIRLSIRTEDKSASTCQQENTEKLNQLL